MFSNIDGDKDTIMGLPIKKIKDYLEEYEKFLVIGNPIEHSISPKLHNYWFKETKIDAIYQKQKLDENQLNEFINRIREKKLDGANITLPFKEKLSNLLISLQMKQKKLTL